jgi:hypothetical protein
MSDFEANARRTGDEQEANVEQTGYLFVPLFNQFRRNLRRDFVKNESTTWIPVECSLLVCYEFAACSLQTRYIFVAILLLCGMRGSDKIPADPRFLAKALSADRRTVEKSIRELVAANLLAERKTERKKDETRTDRETEAAGADSENLSKTNSHQSQFSLEECLQYVQICETKGEKIISPKGLANHLYKTGDADAFILATLYPKKLAEAEREIYGEPRRFLDEPCLVCFGSKMEVVEGRGARPCPNCKNEKGSSTGKQPEGEKENE